VLLLDAIVFCWFQKISDQISVQMPFMPVGSVVELALADNLHYGV
jgi:hypothetical protein